MQSLSWVPLPTQPPRTKCSCYSIVLVFNLVFSPRDLYYRGQKNNNIIIIIIIIIIIDDHDDVYGDVVMTKPLREFTRVTWMTVGRRQVAANS